MLLLVLDLYYNYGMVIMMRKSRSSFIYKVIRPIVKGLVYLFFRPKVIGKENIPKNGPYVLAGNHTKWLDPVMLIGVSGRNQLHFLAKEEMWHGKSWIIVKAMDCIPVNRKIHDKDALVSAYNYLNDGKCIGIFPEGTINRTNDIIMPFKIGAVKMCKETNALLVPFVITGKYKWFGKGITIEFLKPRRVTEDLTLENDRLMECISDKLSENLVGEAKRINKKRGKKNGKK